MGSTLLLLVSIAVMVVASPLGAARDAGLIQVPQRLQNCPSEAPLDPGRHARELAIAAVRESLRAGPQDWRTFQIQSAYPATSREGFGAIAVHMCGPVVGSRTWVVEMHFPNLEPSASLSQGQAFVSRFRSGWRVWYRYH